MSQQAQRSIDLEGANRPAAQTVISNSSLPSSSRPIPPPPQMTPEHAEPTLGTGKRRRVSGGGFCSAAAARRTPAKPDSWLQRKFAIGIVIALSVWSFYVVVGRVCVPLIRGDGNQPFSKATGAGTLVGYVIIFALYAASYVKMVTTSPGFARDHVAKSPPPAGPPQASPDYIPYTAPYPPSQPPLTQPNPNADSSAPDPSEFAPITNALPSFPPHPHQQQEPEPRPSSSATLSPSAHQPFKASQQPLPQPAAQQLKGKALRAELVRTLARPVPYAEPGPRWCRYCEINKPDRTHHCRHCGTCVLAFDHHCLWIGQCVGWGNHKFFIIFTFWGTLFTMYILIWLCVVAAKSTTTDGQIIGLIAVSALFCLFTSSMLASHIHLILSARTTVESFSAHDQSERESALLNQHFGYLWHNADKRLVRKRWEDEFGGVQVDWRWKVGRAGDRWRREMGRSVLGWILPVGRPMGDGMHYEQHPAFGPHGEWRRKDELPKDDRGGVLPEDRSRT